MSAFIRMEDRNEWVAEASDLGNSRAQCPNCNTELSGNPERSYDEEGDITKWSWHCHCGHKITILND